LDTVVLDGWLRIVEQVNTTTTSFYRMIFPPDGKRVMQSMPFGIDEKRNLESVLVVSHDITERKSSNRDQTRQKNQRFITTQNESDAILPTRG